MQSLSYIENMVFRKLVILLGFLLGWQHVGAQQQPIAEVFCGAELSYADVNFTRLYNSLINLTPGVKVHLGQGWDVAAQVYLPIVNEGYADRYNMVRLNMANISKTFRFERARQYVKVTAGLFGKEQYGGDIRWMWPITSWLLFHARMGLTDHWALGTNIWEGTAESEFNARNFSFTGLLGASVWLRPWATELRATGGRYLNHDYGAEGEIVRHFNHCSISVFAQYHEYAPSAYIKNGHRYSGGFRIVMMLPPYKKQKNKDVVVRPASNFRLTYNAQADGYSMKKYTTDPEENERTYPIQIPWGTGLFNE